MEARYIKILSSISNKQKVSILREGPIEDSLIRFGIMAKEKKTLIRNKNNAKEISKCTFVPAINGK